MWLTGWAPDRLLGPPAGLIGGLDRLAARLREATARAGRPVDVDPLDLLVARAGLTGLAGQGRTSCGGASRLLRVADGWMAVTLARPEDVELVPAWLERAVVDDDPWPTVERAVATADAAALVERARVLGLPVAALPRADADAASTDGLPWSRWPVDGEPAAPRRLDEVVVVELASLWSGPLCGALLAAAGARVVKVESTQRPDGARSGPSAFFDLLNHGKQSVALDLTSSVGRRDLARLIRRADVVIEGSRPRALEQLGLDATALTATGPRVWASITAYGRRGAGRDRVGFGDDAAVGGGLVGWAADDSPCFCADAVADPATGLAAATAIVDALDAGGRWMVDVPLATVAAHLGGPTLPVSPGVEATRPAAPAVAGPGPRLGQHNEEVLGALARD
jgi:hypothetical protein